MNKNNRKSIINMQNVIYNILYSLNIPTIRKSKIIIKKIKQMTTYYMNGKCELIIEWNFPFSLTPYGDHDTKLNIKVNEKIFST